MRDFLRSRILSYVLIGFAQPFDKLLFGGQISAQPSLGRLPAARNVTEPRAWLNGMQFVPIVGEALSLPLLFRVKSVRLNGTTSDTVRIRPS